MKKKIFKREKYKKGKAYFKKNISRGLKKNVLSIIKKVILILLLIFSLIFIIYKKNISLTSSQSSPFMSSLPQI